MILRDLTLQELDYTEDPVDIPNPDRGAYRGRWQWIDTPHGRTPEVDHRVPVSPQSVPYHGATLVAPGQVGVAAGDDIEETEFFDGVDASPFYVGGTGVTATPSIAFLGFDLCHFSSNAFLSRSAGRKFDDELAAAGGVATPEMFAGRTGVTRPLTDYALDFLRGKLQLVREGNGTALVKFSYDGNGFNYVEGGESEHLIYGPEPTYVTPNNPSPMCDVPGHTDKTWIEYHVWQLGPVLREFEDVIWCVKTGMLGPWGEQHTSPEAENPAAYKSLLDAYLAAVPESRVLLTHPGGALAWYNATYGTSFSFHDLASMPAPEPGTPEARLGLFNDSYAAGHVGDSWSDHGSLSEGGRMLSPDPDDDGFDREHVVAWVGRQGTIVQGEGGLVPNVYSQLPGAQIEASELGTTALNMRHGVYGTWAGFKYTEKAMTAPVTFPKDHTEVEPPYTGRTARAFFDPVYEGRSGLEYFRDRLGYRLVLRESSLPAEVEAGGTLRGAGAIQNVGFGPVVNRKAVALVLAPADRSAAFTAPTDLDARDWRPAANGNGRPDNVEGWHRYAFDVELAAFGDVPPGEYDVLLKINDPLETSASRRCVRFANRGSWDAGLGANRIGTVVVR